MDIALELSILDTGLETIDELEARCEDVYFLNGYMKSMLKGMQESFRNQHDREQRQS